MSFIITHTQTGDKNTYGYFSIDLVTNGIEEHTSTDSS